ncbi:hypothetical protein BX666DRAFT_1876871 [Dichotomocladium elegans]|nr:hypothetical protein BX666DRAFT_1876871 [Dichotomocladium elegans]
MANHGRPASSLDSGSASILRHGIATPTDTGTGTIAAGTTGGASIAAAATQHTRSRSASVRSIFSNPPWKTGVSAPLSTAAEEPGAGAVINGMVARPKRSSSLSSQQSAVPTSRHSSSMHPNYSARFSWLTGPGIEQNERGPRRTIPPKVASGTTTTTNEMQSSQDNVDDGRRELLYRGIRVKEIKTTLKTMVIPHDVENPMPQIKLERPGFARINY